MHHYGYFVLEFHYGVYSAEGDAVKRRGGGKGVDDEVCFVIDGYVVVLDEVFKEEGDIQFVGSFGAILVFFVERIYYLFSYHCILSFVFWGCGSRYGWRGGGPFGLFSY